MPDTPRGYAETYTLLTAAAATGNGVFWPGGNGMWMAFGTWDGASAQLQVSPDDGTTWIDLDGAVLTADGGWNDLRLPAGMIRVEIADAGTTSVSSNIKPVGA